MVHPNGLSLNVSKCYNNDTKNIDINYIVININGVYNQLTCDKVNNIRSNM